MWNKLSRRFAVISGCFKSIPRPYQLWLGIHILCLGMAIVYCVMAPGRETELMAAAVPIPAPAPAPIPVVASEQTTTIDGMVKPFKSVIISSSLREIIQSIDVSEGDRITAGQTLIRLESEKQRLAVARYEVLVAKATFDQKAAQRLFEQDVASQDDALNKEMELKRLQMEHDIAREDLAQRDIKSPLNGVVVRKFKEAGESVGEVEPILQIMENDRLLLLFYLDANMLASVTMGQEINTRYPELSAETVKKAVVDFIDPEVDARSGLFRVRLLLDNKDESIKPGMRVQADFPAPAVDSTGLAQQ